MAAAEHRIEPCPRRIRGVVNGQTVLDTTRALYVWEWPGYPQYYIPGRRRARFPSRSPRGSRTVSPGLDRAPSDSTGTPLDAWFEEDEEVFVHPRSPYTRVDAIRSHPPRSGSRWMAVVLAETSHRRSWF